MTEEPARESGEAPARTGGSWLPIVLAVVSVVALFHPFLFQGYVLDGNHDRRETTVPFALLCQRTSEPFFALEWNPYIFTGTSALGSGAYVCMYPVSWIAFALPGRALPWLLTGILVVHVGLAFWFAYLLLQRIGGSSCWASVAATMYVFSSAAVMQMIAEINFTTFVYLPLVLYLAAARGDGRPGLNVIGQAVAYALMIVGGNPQLAVYAIGITATFGADRALLSDRERMMPTREGLCAGGVMAPYLSSGARWSQCGRFCRTSKTSPMVAPDCDHREMDGRALVAPDLA